MNLTALGWNQEWEQAFTPYREKGFRAGRVALEHKHMYRVYTENDEVLAEVSGRLRFDSTGRGDFPAVGDWVVLSEQIDEGRAIIHGILPRFSKFSRKAAGNTVEEQIVAANVNTVFLVTALNQDYNLRRMERYLTLAWESGAEPVIILSKADLSAHVEDAILEAEAIAIGVPVHAVNAITEDGVSQLVPYLQTGKTIALLGSSGAGKSTLINRLYGSEVQATGDIRHGDDRGKHTTTHRELVVLPHGGLLIDTPGMRELQLWEASDGISSTFHDIEELSLHCRYPDCKHDKEPGCAIKNALQDGTLDTSRYAHYGKLQRELAYLARKENKSHQAAEKSKWKKIHKEAKRQSNRP
ncbi:MAG: GTPase RsgA [Paenibacillus sp.]|nr:GTPase RsgA [Paenibacillus sp.]